MPIEIRKPAPNEVRGFLETMATTFQEELREDDAERDERVLDPDRMFVAYDGDALVATATDLELRLTVPGGEATAAGVTGVGVLPTHRRQGILGRLMRVELDAIAERGEPLAMLWASEEPIYGRYGYGVATVRVAIEAERDRMRFRDDPAQVGRVRLVDGDEAARVLPPIYERARRETPGMFARSDAWCASTGSRTPSTTVTAPAPVTSPCSSSTEKTSPMRATASRATGRTGSRSRRCA